MQSALRAAVLTSCLASMAIISSCGGGSSMSLPPQPLAITTPSLNGGTWQTPYSQIVQASGGVAPYTWTVSAGALPHNLSLSNSNTNSVTISGTPDTPQPNVSFTIQVTDPAGQTATQPYTISITSSIIVSVSPQPPYVAPNKTQKFVATVSQDPTNQGVTWTLSQNGAACSSACGTVTPGSTLSGKPTTYTAPTAAPAVPIALTATSVADTSQAASATFPVGIPNPIPFVAQPPVPVTASPGGAAFTLTVNGAGFAPGATVNWSGSPRTTTLVSGTQLTAAISNSDIFGANTASVTVFNPGVGGGTSNPVFFPSASAIPSVTLRATSFAAGSAPISAITADFNGDGNPDLAVANPINNGVSVLMGNGDGTFGTATSYATGTASSFLAVGDLNNDGRLDLVVTNASAGSVSVLLGNGDGTFQTAINYPVGATPVSVALADLNGDGFLDLAVANQNCSSGPPLCGQGTVSILLGNGDGTFQAHVEYSTGPGPNSVTIGDFNSDGKLDLAVAAGDGGGKTGTQVSVLLGNGDGTFQSAVSNAAGLNPVALATADFNNDGKSDLAVADSGGSIAILLGNGDGTFQTPVDYPVGTTPNGSLAIGDFNNDGKLDLAVADSGSNAISVLLGNGDGTFQTQVQYATGQNPSGVAVGDFNRDGRMDFAVANQTDNTVSILVQTSSLTLSAQSLSFGTQIVGTSSSAQMETLTNIGPAPITLSISAITGTNPADFGQSTTCSSTLAPTASCTIAVTFMPGQVGPSGALIAITDDSAGSPLTVSLAGTGVVSGPNVTFSATSLSFGDQLVGTTSAPQSVTLTNYGSAALNIAGIAASTNFGETDNCSPSLAPLASCTINVTFTPSVIDSLNGTVTITDNAPASPQTISLNGAGTFVQLTPLRLSFGCSYNFNPFRPQCHCLTSKITTLTNTASAALNISDISVTGLSFSLGSNTCGGSVGVGQSCTINVGWSPDHLPNGFYGGSLSISDNGGGSPQSVPLSAVKHCSPF